MPYRVFEPAIRQVRVGAARLAAGLFAGALVAAAPASAALRLSHLFTDHAVLQRERPLRVWGWATPGARIDVELAGRAAVATADRLGRWEAWFAPLPAGGPYTLAAKGDGGTLLVSDIMLGDVWLASGQSNMEMPLSGFPPQAYVANAAAEIASAGRAKVRLLRLERRSSAYPLNDIAQSWTLSTPQTAADFSAVGFLFGREIAEREHVTVGIIDATWGGTPADAWVSLDALSADPSLYPAFAARAHLAEDEVDKAEILAAEAREDAEAKTAGRSAQTHEWRPPEESWRPGALYNAMIAPLTPAAIKGVIWYQGETNSKPDRAPYYAALFKGLITDWRQDFAQGDFPFIFTQISSFDSPHEAWGLARDAQRRALALRDTAIVTTTDVGEPHNVHPADKQTVAARFALAARGLAYGEDVAYAPPLFRQVSGEPGGLRVWFDHAKGLTSRSAPLGGFEIAGPDHRFVPAAARIEHDTVRVEGPVARPTYVRFNWSNVAGGEIYNAAGLPAPSFTSEPRLAGQLVFP